MRPITADVALSRELAARVREIGGSRVRRVVMIGSRARGTARHDSDLDLVVLVEIPGTAKSWTEVDCRTEAVRIMRDLGPLPLKLDLAVRTTDRYREARQVIGGLEWAVMHEGFVLFKAPFSRPPVVRVTPENVRRELVSTWVHHALAALEAFDGSSHGWTASELASAVYERLCSALLVAHGTMPAYLQGVDGMLPQLEPLEPEMTGALRHYAASARYREAALCAVQEVHTRLMRDPLQARVLVKAGVRLQTVRQGRTVLYPNGSLSV